MSSNPFAPRVRLVRDAEMAAVRALVRQAYAGDFGLMPYMAGWASYCDGNAQLAQEFAQQAAKVDKAYAGLSAEQPVLVLFETGRAPFKYGGGKYGEVLKWAPYETPAAQMVKTASADTGWKAHIGGSFNQIIGGEIGYADFGKYGVENSGANAITPAVRELNSLCPRLIDAAPYRLRGRSRHILDRVDA